MTGCDTPGCPCLDYWRGYPRGTNPREREVIADDMDVSAVLRRGDEPGAGAGLSHHDKYRVFKALNERGYSARQIAECLSLTGRTITRWRGYLTRTLVGA